MIKFADFCAGIGGFRLGLEKLGLECVYSCEVDNKCEETYRANFSSGFEVKNIAFAHAESLPQMDIFCAGFPCQPFSIAGKREGFSDKRSNVFNHIVRLIEKSSPEVLFLENVKHLLHHQKGITFKIILRMLDEQGYYVKYKIINSKYYGVPQSRERLFIIGFKSKAAFQKFSFPSERTVSTVVKDILVHGNIEQPVSSRWLEYIELYSGRKSINQMSFSVPKTRGALEKKPDEVLLDDCILQLRSSGIRAIPIFDPFPTFAVSISGGGAMIPVYVREKRHLSLIEMKRLMGFPDDFLFPVARTHSIKQLANAVCPPVITRIGEKILEAITKKEETTYFRPSFLGELYEQISLFDVKQ